MCGPVCTSHSSGAYGNVHHVHFDLRHLAATGSTTNIDGKAAGFSKTVFRLFGQLSPCDFAPAIATDDSDEEGGRGREEKGGVQEEGGKRREQGQG